jgi:hypothetical protein
MFDPVLDRPIRGVRAIAAAANIIGEDGEIDERAAYYALERGHYDASKRGRTWETTLRRLLAPHLGHIKQSAT